MDRYVRMEDIIKRCNRDTELDREEYDSRGKLEGRKNSGCPEKYRSLTEYEEGVLNLLLKGN